LRYANIPLLCPERLWDLQHRSENSNGRFGVFGDKLFSIEINRTTYDISDEKERNSLLRECWWLVSSVYYPVAHCPKLLNLIAPWIFDGVAKHLVKESWNEVSRAAVG